MSASRLTSWWRAGALASLVTYLLLTIAELAVAGPPDIEPTGSDLWSNITPADLGGRADQYPLSAWSLDYPFEAVTGLGIGGPSPDFSGIPALALHEIAGTLWDLHVEISKGVLTLFSWAFGTNLLDERYGVLGPIAQVTTDLYNALGTWVSVAVLGLGAVLTWQLFVRRDVGGTVGQLVATVIATTVALLIVNNPAWTAQFSSSIARNAAAGLLSITSDRTSGDSDSDDPRIRATDALWTTLVADPWTVLQFGGMEHCVDGEGRPARPGSRECEETIDHRAKYNEAFLTGGPANGGTRKAFYEALATGETPSDDRIEELNADEEEVKAFRVSEADKPAADLMGKSGAQDRLAFTPLIFLGGLGANVMIGVMAAVQIIMQIYFLLLLTLAPVMLLAAMIPARWSQGAFRGWIARLIGALLKQVVIALILGVAVAIAAALTNAGAQLGWLFVFLAQAIFWWALFFWRREIASMVGVGHSREDDAPGRTAQRAMHKVNRWRKKARSDTSTSSGGDSGDGGGGGVRKRLERGMEATASTTSLRQLRRQHQPNSGGPERQPQTKPEAPDGDRSPPAGSGTNREVTEPRAPEGHNSTPRPPPVAPGSDRPASANGQPPGSSSHSDTGSGGEGGDSGPRWPLTGTSTGSPTGVPEGDPSPPPASSSLDDLDESLARDRARVQPLRQSSSRPAGPPRPGGGEQQGDERPTRRPPPDGPAPRDLEPPQPPPPRKDEDQ